MSDKWAPWAQRAFADLIGRAAAKSGGQTLDADAAARLTANVNAMKALYGDSGRPESAIAALLRSEHPIEPEVREALAKALEGNAPIRLEAVGLSYGKEHRRRRALSVSLMRGRRAIELMQGSSYEDGIKAAAKESGVSEKTVIANVAFARKLDAWVAGAIVSNENFGRYNRLELIYLDATHEKSDPDELLSKRFAEWLDTPTQHFRLTDRGVLEITYGDKPMDAERDPKSDPSN